MLLAASRDADGHITPRRPMLERAPQTELSRTAQDGTARSSAASSGLSRAMIDGVWMPVAEWPLHSELDVAAMVLFPEFASRHKVERAKVQGSHRSSQTDRQRREVAGLVGAARTSPSTSNIVSCRWASSS
jgi:hypothetical protein